MFCLLVLLKSFRRWITWIKPSVNSRQTLDNYYLSNSFQKDPIASPKMSDNNSWEQIDSAVSNLHVGAASVFDRVELLEKSIYDQGSLLFGLLPRKEKSLSGLNRRAQHSIKLVTEKNELLARINNTSDQCTKIPFRLRWKTFAQDFKSSAVVSLAGKDVGK